MSRLLVTMVAIILLLPLPAAAASPSHELTALEERPLAPDFALRDVEGNIHRLSDLRGRPVIVNFWATWCPPCRAEMPSMQRAWEQLRERGVMMLAVNVGEEPEAVSRFLEKYPVEFPLLMDRHGNTADDWSVKGMPLTFVVDQEGRIAFQAIGGREWDDPELLQPVLSLRNIE